LGGVGGVSLKLVAAVFACGDDAIEFCDIH
jgi:hypothetical protein